LPKLPCDGPAAAAYMVPGLAGLHVLLARTGTLPFEGERQV
jgi:hypothetical protein